MIQEIFPHRFSNQFLSNAPFRDTDIILHYNGNSLLFKISGNGFELPKKKDFPQISEKTKSTFLFTLNDISCFLIWDNLNPDMTNFAYKDPGFFRSFAQKETAWISLVGYQLANWYTSNKFCGKCGSQTQEKQSERAIECTECGSVVFPKISPAIIVAILSKDKILLARNSGFRESWYSLIAGYADVGESLEETVVREVQEEVGLVVRNIRYYKSQPWPLSGSMMIGFIADADENQPIVTDNQEITEAAWFTRENLPDHPSNLSIAGLMIEKFKRGELESEDR